MDFKSKDINFMTFMRTQGYEIRDIVWDGGRIIGTLDEGAGEFWKKWIACPTPDMVLARQFALERDNLFKIVKQFKGGI